MLRQLGVTTTIITATCAFAQTNIIGPHEYPQFRTLSGLSGGGFGVRPDGTPAFDGAMALSTPIGYSLGHWNGTLTASNTSDYWFFRLPHITGYEGKDDSIGKFSGCGGVTLGHFGSLCGSFMVVSSQWDTEFNLQYQAPLFYKNVGISAGVQDTAGTRYDRATGLPGRRSSQSWFSAATVPLKCGVYVSGGWGTRRFDKGFANVSVPIGDRFKAIVEEDGLGVNEMVAWNPKAVESYKLFGRAITTTMMLGFIDSRYAVWSLNFGM